ncbi:hypothetical protein D3C85_1416660 [compost metagenome]
MDSISPGFSPDKLPTKTPSTTYKGFVLLIVPKPRIFTVGLEPGEPLTTVTPAALPCKADSALVIGTAVMSFEVTVEIAPVTFVLF